jgi:hypothetical protein
MYLRMCAHRKGNMRELVHYRMGAVHHIKSNGNYFPLLRQDRSQAEPRRRLKSRTSRYPKIGVHTCIMTKAVDFINRMCYIPNGMIEDSTEVDIRQLPHPGNGGPYTYDNKLCHVPCEDVRFDSNSPLGLRWCGHIDIKSLRCTGCGKKLHPNVWFSISLEAFRRNIKLT